MKKLIALISLLSLPALAAYQPATQATVDSNNSSTTTRDANLAYTGTYTDVTSYGSISVVATSDVAGTLYYDFSNDGTNLLRRVTLSGSTPDMGIHSLIPISKWGRVVVQNGGTTQAAFVVQTVLHPTARIAQPTSRLTQNLGDYSDVLNTRAAIVGVTDGGGFYNNAGVDVEGHFEVNISGPRSAFGEVNVIQPTPVAQIDAVYNTVNSLFMSTNASGAGTVSAANQMFAISTGADSNSSASAYSKRYAKYRPGQGVLARWTALYSANSADSYTFSGMLDADQNANGFGFGYTNTTYGIWHWNGGTYTHIPQTSWNIDTMLGGGGATNKSGILLDPSKLNVYQARLTYLGAGNIDFFIMSPTNGQFIKVHTLSYPNLNTTPSLAQPSLNVGWRAVNGSGSATEKIVRGASAAMFVEGLDRVSLGPIHGEDAFIDEFSSGGVTNLLAIRNATSFNGKVNRARIKLRTVSLGSSAGTGASSEGAAIVRLLRNPAGTLTNFTMVSGSSADQGVTITSGESVASYDKSNTAMSAGSKEFIATVSLNNSQTLDLEGFNLFINPADVISFAVEVKGSDQDVTVGVTWSEEL